MANQQLLDYIKQQLEQEVSKEEIKNNLLTNGWQASDIDEAFRLVSGFNQTAQPPAQSFQPPTSRPAVSSLPRASAILAEAWSIYKQRFWIFLGVMVVPMAIILVFSLLLAGGIGASALIGLKYKAGGMTLLFLLLAAFFLSIFISQFWGQVALLYAIKDREEKIGIIESYRRGWHKILSYLGISILTGFITFLGFLLLIVPGIIFAVWFSLAAFVLVAEDLRGMKALKRSREYVKGHLAKVFWRFLFIGLLTLVIGFIPALIFNLLHFSLGEDLVGFLVGLFLTPLVMTFSFLVYSYLRTIKSESTA